MALSKRIGGSLRAGGQWAGMVLLVVLVAGCGHGAIYPVHGQLVDPEGKPLAGMQGATIVFECEDAQSSANGTVAEDGTFHLTTEKANDGAHVGKHRVAISRPYLAPQKQAPHVILPKYESIQTSGLEVVVEPKNNDVTLTVERFHH